MEEIWEIAQRSNYEQRVNNTAYIAKRWWPEGVLSNQWVFNWRCPTVCLLKDFPWILHHKDGVAHTEGDVMGYFDRNDTNVTAEIVINITKKLTIDCKEQTTIQNNYFLPENIKLLKLLKKE